MKFFGPEMFNSFACILITYPTRAIISRGLYIFYPISKDHFFVFKEVVSQNSVRYHIKMKHPDYLVAARVIGEFFKHKR